MTLTAADVAEIMRLVEQSGFDEVILEVDGVKLCLRKGAAMERSAADGASRAAGTGTSAGDSGNTAASGIDSSAARASATQGTAFSGAAPSVGVGSTAGNTSAPGSRSSAAHEGVRQGAASGAAATPVDPNIHDVPSPLLGTFYRAPKPGAPPFVEVGSQVDENTVVAIIEVMKLMNTVRAGVRGTVTEILVADGALAEYSQPLLRVRKAG